MASTKIEYAKGGTDYRTKGTISCWVKRSSLGAQQDIWSWGENNSSDAYLRFDTADNVEMHCDGAGGTFNTTQLYRDVNGWYHFVFSLDGSNATANLRRRFWINGVQIDEGMGSLAAFSGAVFGWHSTQDLWIGARARSQQSGDTEYFNGYMSHFHYCSNYSYAASDFGSFDNTTGEWKINTNPNVQYGSEGFFLKMEDSSNLDLDSSGNNKTLTTSGTLIASKDCPSNIFDSINLNLTRSGGVAGRDGSIRIFVENGNTKLSTDVALWTTMLGSIPISSGKYYYECKRTFAGSPSNHLARVGIEEITTAGTTLGSPVGTNTDSINFQSEGGGLKGNSAYSGTFNSWQSNNDIVQVAIDLDNNFIYFGVNNVWQNSGNPESGASGTGGIAITANKTYVTGFTVHRGGGSAGGDKTSLMLNFGNGNFGDTAISSAGNNASGIGVFELDVPAGYTAISTKGVNS